ncbi:MAG: exodeoxyribonuclease III [Rickettsiales bacterium]|nr:exodeoxyribonuclease III [Rickettsiales bacterium]
MKISSFNINSVRLRLPLLKKFVDEASPDVICLQETKVVDELFPLLEIKALGFDYVEFSGEKSYNGVAILSKVPLKNRQIIDVKDFGHKRHIAASLQIGGKEVELHNVYIPAGGDEADPKINPKFDHKLQFLDWMEDHFKAKKDKHLIIVGDFNIAPLEHDVWSHKQLLKVVSHTPIEVERLGKVQQSANFIDTHRHFVAHDEKLYSWWSYRGREPFKSNRGRRLDHIWCSPSLKDNLKDFKIYKDYRIQESPSDHVPILTEFYQ